MKALQIALIAVFTATLMGCGAPGEDELRQWMASERAQAKPNITPIAEPKQFNPQPYGADSGMEPFNPLKLTQALRRESAQMASNAALIAPEMARRKEPLEAYPLDAMAMVGSLNKTGKPTALLKVDKLLYQVQIGNYLGPNYGRITAITETAIQLREIVQDATGDWIERATSLELQEEAKK
ncbi:pilus assembly protein PilP [Simplicispira lacusdiani]|uniref:pilus assembly protein PilP n=1 Tax=Simplicispira lacusdiani TaxID=2213010 RepID=UPI000E755184|nr:pilus assembly protein PilP [Simplicispira lacusdiani]